MANYWLFDALYEGNAGYSHNPKLGLAYLQKAVDLGVPLAQYELARIYENKMKDVKTSESLLAAQPNKVSLQQWTNCPYLRRLMEI